VVRYDHYAKSYLGFVQQSGMPAVEETFQSIGSEFLNTIECITNYRKWQIDLDW